MNAASAPLRSGPSAGGPLRGPFGPVGPLSDSLPSEPQAPTDPPAGLEHSCGSQPAWLWPGYHCTFDKDLKRDYGIGCADYWRIFDHQGGVCALCGRRPGKQRLVVDEDDSREQLEIAGLLHRSCNRRVSQAIRRYVASRPAREIGPFYVSASRAARRRKRLDVKREARRKAARENREAAASQPTQPSKEDYASRVAAAIASSTQATVPAPTQPPKENT